MEVGLSNMINDLAAIIVSVKVIYVNNVPICRSNRSVYFLFLLLLLVGQSIFDGSSV